MNTSRNIFFVFSIGFFIITVVGCSPAKAVEPQWITLYDNIPQDAQRIPIALTFSLSDSQFYTDSRQNIRVEKIDSVNPKDTWREQLDLGTVIDGNHYKILLNTSDLNFISRNSEQVCMAKIISLKENKESEVLKEGLFILGRDVEIPLKVAPEKLSIPYDKPLSGMLEITIYGNRPAYEARMRTVLNGSLSGSSSIEHGVLNVTLAGQETLDIPGYSVTLMLRPFEDQTASVTSRGKIGDVMRLGAATVVVEKISSNCSKLVLAVLDGYLQPLKTSQQQQAEVMIGKPFPYFARVDLLERRLITLGDLIGKAGPNGFVVLIFGDFKQAISPNYGIPPQPRSLPLDEMMIQDILRKEVDTPVVIGFICQRLSLSDLYEKWLGQMPDFHILSDFSDPMNIQFQTAGMEPHMYRQPGSQGETLRRRLNVPDESVITVLINTNKNTIYINTNAADQLADTLVEINNLLKDSKIEQTDN